MCVHVNALTSFPICPSVALSLSLSLLCWSVSISLSLILLDTRNFYAKRLPRLNENWDGYAPYHRGVSRRAGFPNVSSYTYTYTQTQQRSSFCRCTYLCYSFTIVSIYLWHLLFLWLSPQTIRQTCEEFLKALWPSNTPKKPNIFTKTISCMKFSVFCDV